MRTRSRHQLCRQRLRAIAAEFGWQPKGGRTGKPYGGNHFSESFREWCDAGLPKRCKPHGLRKAACRRLAEAGCSANEIMTISGHTTMKEPGVHPSWLISLVS